MIFQLRRGHRYAVDDLAVAWTAARARPDALRVLDLGAGVGSVGLLTLASLSPAATLVSVEVQARSHALEGRTVAYNGLGDRVELRHADLRSPAATEGLGELDLITGNPPYLTEGTATASPVPQRAAARLELHGDVFDWCRVAAPLLAREGRFCFCHNAADPRPVKAIAAAGLVLLARQELHFRADRPPQLAVYTTGWSGERRDPPPMRIREANGQFSVEWLGVRRDLRIDA